MATPKYDKLRGKVLQWANRDKEVFGVDSANPDGWKSYIGDFLSYAADEAYRLLRVPPMEYERVYTIDSTDIVGSANISVLGTNNWAGTGGVSYCKIPLPIDFIEMKSLRFSGASNSFVNNVPVNPGIVFNEVTDERTFYDIYAETYSNFYYMRQGDFIYTKPALAAGSQVTFSYYRQLPALDADYSVVANNYLFAADDGNGLPQTSSVQPFLAAATTNPPNIGGFNQDYPSRLTLASSFTNTALEEGDLIFIANPTAPLGFSGQVKITSIAKLGSATSTIDVDTEFSNDTFPLGGSILVSPILYFVKVTGGTEGSITYGTVANPARRIAAYNTAADQTSYLAIWQAAHPTLTFTTETQAYDGTEVNNWLKDQNERILVWGALMHAGSFLDDEKIEARYGSKFNNDIDSLNKEERMRKAKGGNVQVHFNGRGLI